MTAKEGSQITCLRHVSQDYALNMIDVTSASKEQPKTLLIARSTDLSFNLNHI